MVYPNRRKIPLYAHERLRLYKCMGYITNIANSCPDEGIRTSLYKAARELHTTLEFTQLLERYRHKIRE